MNKVNVIEKVRVSITLNNYVISKSISSYSLYGKRIQESFGKMERNIGLGNDGRVMCYWHSYQCFVDSVIFQDG